MWIVKQKTSPYWQARFEHPDGSGRIVQVSTREKTERAARTRGEEILAQYKADHQRALGGGFVTTVMVAEQYWDAELSKRKWGPGTAFRWLEAVVDHLGDDKRYCDVTIADVATFVEKIDGTVSDTTLNRALAIWRRMHNYAAEIREYPVKSIKFAKLIREEPEGRTRNATPEEIAAILKHLPVSAQAIVITAVLTGARKQQILTLTWDRVDLEHDTITVFKKSRKKMVPHRLELHPTARAIIAKLKLERGDRPTVFDTTNFRKLWEAGRRKAGIQDFRFHDMRHTAATWLARKSSLLVVKEMLGHSDIKTTMRYAHVKREDLRDGIHRLPAIEMHMPTDETEKP